MIRIEQNEAAERADRERSKSSPRGVKGAKGAPTKSGGGFRKGSIAELVGMFGQVTNGSVDINADAGLSKVPVTTDM